MSTVGGIDLNRKLVSYNDPLYFEVFGFLQHEATLLDNDCLQEWLKNISEDIMYIMPVRSTRNRADGNGFSTEMFHFYDDYHTVKLRADKVGTGHAWAEDPPSRIRRFVSNVRVSELENNRLDVRSYILLFRSQHDDTDFQIVTAERRDTLVRTAEGLKIERREIYADQTVLGLENLAFFI